MNFIEPLSIFAIFFSSFYLIKKRLDIAIYLMLLLSVLLHKELFSFFRWDLLPIRIFMFALLGVYCVELVQFFVDKIIKKEKPRKFLNLELDSPYLVLLITFWIVCGVSIIFSLNLKASILLYGFLTTMVMFFSKFFSEYRNKPELIEKYLKFYIGVAFALTLFGYFQLYLYSATGKIIGAFWNVPGKLSRVGTLFWDVNHYGAFLAALTPLAGILFLTTKVTDKKTLVEKIFYFIATLSLTISLIITNSRSAWIMALVTFLTFVLILLVKKFGAKGILILAIPIIVGISAVGFMYSQKSSPVRAYIKQYLHYRLDSFDSHMLLLQGAFEIFQKYPILGGGYGGFFEHFSKTNIALVFFGRDPVAITNRVPAHTIWGEALANTGGLGFSVYLAFVLSILATILHSAIKTDQKKVFLMCSAMFSILFGWLIAGIFYSYNAEYYWIIWVLFLTYSLGNVVLSHNFSSVLSYYSRSPLFSKSIIYTLAAILIFSALGSTHLIPWDEAIYAKIAKNMVMTGDYVSQFWRNNRIWFEKPPLFMWSEALFMQLIGFSSWAVRLPSAIAGFLTIVVVYKLANSMFNKTVAFLAALSLLTTTSFLYYSRTGMLDIAVTFFITLAFYTYYLAKKTEKEHYLYFTGASLGLALMTKGVVGGIGLVIILLADLVANPRMKVKNYLQIILMVLVVFLPWHLKMYQLYGNDFLNNYIGYHVIDRASSAIEDKGNPIWWYLIVIKVSMRIWFISLILALPYALWRVYKRDLRTFPLLLWFCFVLALFSLAKSKLVWYIMPIYPAAAILNGYFIDNFINKILSYFKESRYLILKSIALLSILLFSLIYLFLNKELVYNSDVTGSQARLMEQKEISYGIEDPVYLDRIELPLALYYLNGPFEVIDFSATKKERVPEVAADKRLYLVTKKGRYNDVVARYNYAPTIVAEDGDWIFWYMAARNEVPSSSLFSPTEQ